MCNESRATFLRSELEYLTTKAIEDISLQPRWDRAKLDGIRRGDIALIKKELAEIGKGEL